MTALAAPLAELLEGGNILELGARAAAARAGPAVGYREDGAVLLVVEGEEWVPQNPPPPSRSSRPGRMRLPPEPAPREIHYLPRREASRREALEELQALRRRFPGVWIHGLSPEWLARRGDLPLDSLALFTGPAEEEEGPWCRWLDLDRPMVASAIYSPTTPIQALVRRLERLRSASGVRTLVWLPSQPGDRGYQARTTTDGPGDMALLAVTRLAYPDRRVRASWAALGWKLAQVAVAFGADEVAGWGLEEYLAWGRGAQPASVVDAAEARAGIREAGGEPREVCGCVWGS